MQDSEALIRKYAALIAAYIEECLGTNLPPNLLFTIKDALEDLVNEIK